MRARAWVTAISTLVLVALPAVGPAQAVAIDPSRSGTIYAGDELGIFRSADGGGIWTPVSDTPNVDSLAFDPSDPSTAYAGSLASWQSRLPGTILKTTDGGSTWSP